MATSAAVETGKPRAHPTLWVGIFYALTIAVVLAVVEKL
jgi:hypothetical protein